MFERFKHAKRISKLEEAVEAMTSSLDSLETEVTRILELRKKERARHMASLRWDEHRKSTAPENGAPGTAIGMDPVSLKIKQRRQRTLADLAMELPRDPEETSWGTSGSILVVRASRALSVDHSWELQVQCLPAQPARHSAN
jgi:hypothetical protein